MTATESSPELSVVVPVFNERDNVAPLVNEIVAALRGRIPFEIVYVDDQSKDDSLAVLTGLMATVPELRVVQHLKQSGQSTAVRNGIKAARGAWIATLDGDGQNDPADIPKLLDQRASADPDIKLFAGWRVNRKDTGSKRWASKAANAIRSRLLRDETPDTGCGIKLFERAVFLDLPYFDHMHRYLPALVKRAGWKSVSVPVNHRERGSGVSKYNNLGRAWVGLADLRGVGWLIKRSKITGTTEVGRSEPGRSETNRSEPAR
jgi:dolichol-phosphate mannosyltransferase